jgi:hypothetical protein
MNIIIYFTKPTQEYAKNGYNNFLFSLKIDENYKRTFFEEYMYQFSSDFKEGNCKEPLKNV